MTDDSLRGPRVLIRPATADDRPALVAIRTSPAVARWWDAPAEEWPLNPSDSHRYTVLLDGTVIGFVQWYENDDVDHRHAGIDVFLDAAHHGQGLGRETVTTVLRHLLDDRGHHRVVIDPAVDNTAAITCYRASGFQDVGVMRRYERRPADGTWHDNLLMEHVVDPATRVPLPPAPVPATAEPRADQRPVVEQDGAGSGTATRPGPEVTLTAVDADSWRAVAELDVTDDQRAFVAPVTRYLAMCAYDDGPWHPLAVSVEGEVVGFAMEAVDPADGSYWIGGLVVDAAWQGRGIGRATVAALVARARTAARPSAALSFEPSNVRARRLYASLGFVETGETDGTELVARLAL
jgi:aminoglycoside 6'-N-acetyltransferase